jgi:hypothetical protein
MATHDHGDLLESLVFPPHDFARGHSWRLGILLSIVFDHSQSPLTLNPACVDT